MDEDAREIGAVGPAPSVLLMDAVTQYLGVMKIQSVDGKPIAAWLNRCQLDNARHRRLCDDFADDLLDLVNRLRARSWLKFLTRELGDGIHRDETAAGEARLAFEIESPGRTNPFRKSQPFRRSRSRELIAAVLKNGDPRQYRVLISAMLSSFERAVLDEDGDRAFSEIIKEKAFQSYEALRFIDIEELLSQAGTWMDSPVDDASREVIDLFLDPPEQQGISGCLTQELSVRLFRQYRILASTHVPPEAFEGAQEARGRIVGKTGLTFRKLCHDLASVAALADSLHAVVCADAAAPHRAGVRLLLENLSALGRLATLCLESAALLSTERPGYGSARREAEPPTAGTGSVADYVSSTPAAELRRTFDEARKSWGRAASEGSAAGLALQGLRAAVDQLDDSHESVAEVAAGLLNVLDRLDNMTAKLVASEVDIPAIYRIRLRLLPFVREHAGIVEYTIKAGDLARDHPSRYETRTVTGTTKIAAVVKPGYWRASKKEMLLKPLVDLA